ncbi:MAG: hypothetical protein F4Y99_03440 [Acidimicrobiaceae bacterium]|nr:hypothetical protein [Acidimicrobiaceae bacterium]
MNSPSPLNLPKLIDRYEIKARLLPALLACLPMVPGLAALGSEGLDWDPSLAVESGIVSILWLGLCYLASAAGNHYQRRLWPRWPHDAPTNRWLHPDDTHLSTQQKLIHYKQILDLVGLDIQHASKTSDSTELEQTINDAVRNLRLRLKSINGRTLLQIHTEDYGFARNFAGMVPFWIFFSILSAALAWVAYFRSDSGLSWAVVATIALVIAIAIVSPLKRFVRQRAEQYADTFLGTMAEVHNGYHSQD